MSPVHVNWIYVTSVNLIYVTSVNSITTTTTTTTTTPAIFQIEMTLLIVLLLQNLTRFVWIFSVSNDGITIETIIIVGCVCGFVVVCLTFILCILCWRRHVATSEIFYSIEH